MYIIFTYVETKSVTRKKSTRFKRIQRNFNEYLTKLLLEV